MIWFNVSIFRFVIGSILKDIYIPLNVTHAGLWKTVWDGVSHVNSASSCSRIAMWTIQPAFILFCLRISANSSIPGGLSQSASNSCHSIREWRWRQWTNELDLDCKMRLTDCNHDWRLSVKHECTVLLVTLSNNQLQSHKNCAWELLCTAINQLITFFIQFCIFFCLQL